MSQTTDDNDNPATASSSMVRCLNQYKQHIVWASAASRILQIIIDKKTQHGGAMTLSDDVDRLLTADLLWHIVSGHSQTPEYIDRIHDILSGETQDVSQLQAVLAEYGLCASSDDVTDDDNFADRLNGVLLKLKSAAAAAVENSFDVSMSLLHSSLVQYDAIRRSPSADYLIHQLTAVEVQIEQLVAQLVNKVIGTPSSVTLMKYLAVQHLLKSDRNFVAALSSQSDVNRQYDVIRSHVIHPTTRVWLLKRIASWIDAESSRRQFFVVLGRTGTGKTALSSAVCKIFSKRVTSCYFFTDRSSSGDGNAQTMRSLLFTLAHGLMSTRPEYLSYLDEKFGSSRLDEELKSLSWKQVYKTLIKEPLQLLYGSSTDAQRQSRQVVVVIDALDECKPDEWQDLSLLFNGLRRDLSVTVRLLITCRSKYSASILGQSILTDSECFCLDDRSWINAHIKDIETYIAHVLGYVLNEQSHRAKDDEVTLQNAIDELVKSSAGRFDFTVQLMSFFSREMKTTGQFLTSLKKASQTLDKTHGDLYRKKTTYFQSLFRAYRDKEGRAVDVPVTKHSPLPSPVKNK